MDEHLAVAPVFRWNHGKANAQPSISVRPLESPEKPVAIVGHDELLQQASRAARHEDRHVRPVRFLQPFRQRVADPERGEILRFDIDVPPRRRDRIMGEPDGLAAPRGLAERRHRPPDRDRAVAQVRYEVVRPGRRRGGDHVVPLFPGRLFPAPARKLRHRASSRAAKERLNVVHRPVWFAIRLRSPRVVLSVLTRVPSSGGKIDAADESRRVVDGHDLLVMRATQRMARVETQVNPGVARPPVLAKQFQRMAGIDRPHRPHQNPYLEIRAFLRQA